LVSRHKEAFGLNRCLRALGVSKGTWHYRQKRDERQAEVETEEQRLKAVVVEVIEEHPAYGYRRLVPELQARGEEINHKRLRRLLNEWDLCLMRTVARPRPSGVREILHQGAGKLNLVKGWDPEPLEMLSTDFTEFHYAGGRKKAYLMALLDPASAWVPGWAVGPSTNRELALRCWSEARKHLDEVAGLVVHSDQDSVYTSYEWLRTLIVEGGVVISFSENGAKDNPWIESFWSRFKSENHSLLWEAATLAELIEVVDRQMMYYNHKRRHSSLAYQSPLEYLHQEGILPNRVSRN
jgi:putative transposase